MTPGNFEKFKPYSVEINQIWEPTRNKSTTHKKKIQKVKKNTQNLLRFGNLSMSF